MTRAFFEIVLSVTLVAYPAFAESNSPRSCAGLQPTETCLVNMEPGKPCIGTDESDIIIGSSENDVILGGGGNDKILGQDGDDTICGEDGDDTLMGDTGNDNLIGGSGSNVLSAGPGDDNCYEAAIFSNCESRNPPKKSASAANCAAVLGKWHWFDNGMVLFTEDNKVQWHEPMTNRKGHSAQWKCNPESGSVTIPWTNGFTDTMSVISSGNSLQGKNNRGMTIWAQKIPE